MKYIKLSLQFSGLVLLIVLLSSCGGKKDKAEENAMDTAMAEEIAEKSDTPTLPTQYQGPAYMIGEEMQVPPPDESDEVTLKVGATIRSTGGPQPLWDIMKRLAAMKDMNVSWQSDVDRNALVDVDIRANDDYFKAIDNLLRQVDYFHEVQGTTIIVKYKETKQYHVAMPFIKQAYKTNTGGDVLGGSGGGEETTNVAGEISLMSDGVAINRHRDGQPMGVEFNIWNSIENNLNAILDIWTTDEVENTAITRSDQTDFNHENNPNRAERDFQTDTKLNEQEATATIRRSSGENSYYIDKPVGLITVTAPRPLIERLDAYFKSLKKELYKQIAIEAKIIEVELTDNSSIGINWNNVLRNFSIDGMIEFGSKALGGQVYPYVFADSQGRNDNPYPGSGVNGYTDRTYDPTRFVSKIRMNDSDFNIFLNALKEEGQTKVLSNPKISVLNGQPALMTVGRNVTYIDNITANISSGDNPITTFETETARVLSGVGLALTANILEDNEIILNLVPVTSDLMEPIEYRQIGQGVVGLPVINVREISTTVKVKDGEMLVIGGLISSTNDEDGSFLPGMGNIPIIKYLFGFEEKTKTKRELIILLRPRII